MHDTHVAPLMYAAASGHVDALRLLLDVGKVNLKELHTNGGSALLEVATGGAGKVMKFFLDKGGEVGRTQAEAHAIVWEWVP